MKVGEWSQIGGASRLGASPRGRFVKQGGPVSGGVVCLRGAFPVWLLPERPDGFASGRRRMADMRFTRSIGLSLLVASSLLLAAPLSAAGQDSSTTKRGRKYKAPPETSHIEVLVTRKSNGKPIVNAAVVFNPSKDGKDEGSLEVKTNPDGKAIIDVIPTGSLVRVQIIANGFATFAEDYQINEPTREIAVTMLRPQEQISAYEDNQGKTSARKPGVQEPNAPAKPATTTTPATKPAAAAPATPPAAPPQ